MTDDSRSPSAREVVNAIDDVLEKEKAEAWVGDALYREESHRAFREILNLGYTEAFRAQESGPGHYTFWDFQRGAWDRNDGIRIDHFLLCPQLSDMLIDCQIDKDVRGRDKPSDHVPVWVDLAA